MKFSRNVRTVLEILKNEVDGDIPSALKKMTSDYSMTWVDLGIDGKSLFPTTSKDIKNDMKTAYVIKGRQYAIRNIAEGEEVIFVELIESFPNPKTKKVYRTPLVLVLETKNGKIRTGRHYLDPRISMKNLSEKEVEKAYRNSAGTRIIIK